MQRSNSIAVTFEEDQYVVLLRERVPALLVPTDANADPLMTEPTRSVGDWRQCGRAPAMGPRTLPWSAGLSWRCPSRRSCRRKAQ